MLSHLVGVGVQAPSSPLVIVSTPLPLLNSFFHPSPICSILEPSGSGPTLEGSPAPCVLPKVWPPAINATVSSSFIAILAKVSLMSIAEASGSGLPLGPCGLT